MADLSDDPPSAINQITLRAGFRARLIAPLLRGKDFVGMLVVRRRAPGAFPQNIVDLIKTGKVDMIINTPLGRESFYDEKSIRRAAIRYNIPCITTLSAANAAARGIRALVEQSLEVAPLQSLHSKKTAAPQLPSGND